ncbi:MAG: hypothetical protein AB7P20_17650 [Rhizobiaceae bacterium]
MKRAFLFGLTAQLICISALFLIFEDQIIPMARSPAIGVVALITAAATVFFAWRAAPHPSWPVAIGMWFAGFVAIYLILLPF